MGTENPTLPVGTRLMLAVQTGDPSQTAGAPAGWLVELRGSPESFVVMDGLPASETAKVVRDTGSHFLTGSEVNVSKDAVTAYSRAERLLEILNGLAGVIDRHYKPVALASPVFRQNADGTRTWCSSFVGGVIFDGNTPFSWKSKPPPTPNCRWLDLAVTDAKVREALALFSRSPRDWPTLYRVFEIVACDIAPTRHSAEAKMEAMSWAMHSEIRLFRQSATPERHGGTKSRLPKQPMQPPDAEGFVRNLLARWISRKV